MGGVEREVWGVRRQGEDTHEDQAGAMKPAISDASSGSAVSWVEVLPSQAAMMLVLAEEEVTSSGIGKGLRRGF